MPAIEPIATLARSQPRRRSARGAPPAWLLRGLKALNPRVANEDHQSEPAELTTVIRLLGLLRLADHLVAQGAESHATEGWPAAVLAFHASASALGSLDTIPSPFADELSRRYSHACEQLLGQTDLPPALPDKLASACREFQTVPAADRAATPLDDLYQRLLAHTAGPRSRQALGAFYTPPPLIEHLIQQTLRPLIDEHQQTRHDPETLLSLRIVDPACGSGRFLLAATDALGQTLAARRAEHHGDRPSPADFDRAFRDVARHGLVGVDIDPTALELCRWTFALAPSNRRSFDSPPALPTLHAADALLNRELWLALIAERPFDLVLGNPPFLSQLDATTAHSRRRATALRKLTNGVVKGYADPAGAFLLLATRITRTGGRIGIVQPLSLIASRDSEPVRDQALRAARLESLWIDEGRTFPGISTLACACSLRRIDNATDHLSHAAASSATTTPPVRLSVGSSIRTIPALDISSDDLIARSSWSILACQALGIPVINERPGATLASIARATADFRDQYYGLKGRIRDSVEPSADATAPHPRFPPLITSGLIDLAHNRWAEIPAKVHGENWTTPRIDLAALAEDPPLAKWAEQRLIPKVLLATQTPIIEAIVDAQGTLLPSVPVLTLTPLGDDDPEALWLIASAVASPVASALALARTCGAALSVRAIKLSARQALDLPLPPDRAHWRCAAEHFRAASETNNAAERSAALREFGQVSIRSFQLADAESRPLLEWWLGRLRRPSQCTPRSPR